jgi:hypothetical protein
MPWGPWRNLGAGPGIHKLTAPAAVSLTPGWLDVFAIGSDDLLWHRSFRDGEWAQWHNHGGNDLLDLRRGVSVASWGPGHRLHFVAIGKDSALWWTPDGWNTGWQRLGGYWQSGPAAVSWEPGRLDVFVMAYEELFHTWYGGGKWHHWGGSLYSLKVGSRPAAASWGPDRLDVVFLGSPRLAEEPVQVATSWYDGGGHWYDWLLGGSEDGWHAAALGGDWAPDTPGVASWAPGRLDIFAIGRSNHLYTVRYDGDWHQWESLGGAVVNEFVSGPCVVSWGPRRLDVFIANSNGQLNWKTFSDTEMPISAEQSGKFATTEVAERLPRPPRKTHADPAG